MHSFHSSSNSSQGESVDLSKLNKKSSDTKETPAVIHGRGKQDEQTLIFSQNSITSGAMKGIEDKPSKKNLDVTFNNQVINNVNDSLVNSNISNSNSILHLHSNLYNNSAKNDNSPSKSPKSPIEDAKNNFINSTSTNLNINFSDLKNLPGGKSGSFLSFSHNFMNKNGMQKPIGINQYVEHKQSLTNTFFSVEKRNILAQRFKNVKEKKLKSQEEFEDNIKIAIQDNNIHSIRRLMLNKENQNVYRSQLEDNIFLNLMLIQGRMEMLTEVLKDPFYKFDETFVFEFLSKKLKQKDKLIDDMESISQFISNVVNYNLYRKSLTRVLGWFIICFGLNEEFLNLVKANEKEYSLEYIQFNHFETDDDIQDYVEEPSNYRRILILCLKEKLENLAIELVIFKSQLENSEVIESALQYNSRLFLRYIWESTNSCNISNSRTKHQSLGGSELRPITEQVNKRKSHLTTFFETSMKKTVFNQGNLVFLISDLVDKIVNLGFGDLLHEIVSTWKFLDRDKNLFQALLKNKAYDEISILLSRYQNNPFWKFTPENFREVINNNGLELILLCLQENSCRAILEEKEIQRVIITNYLSSGKEMYYGAEMLSYIRKTSFNLGLVLQLLNTVEHSIKSKKIINCHSPVLTCLLLCEIASNIGEISVHFYTKCDKTKNDLMTFCKNIHEANPSEKYIKFLLGQKDSKGRSAYQIAAEVGAFMILESPEVGTLVNKMWLGKLCHDGILSFSSLKKFLESPLSRGSNPFKIFDSMDFSKTYFHQLSLWEGSCSLRFYPESLSTVLLIVLYNLFIFFLVTNDQIMFEMKELSTSMQTMQVCYIIWACCIAFNIPLQILYCRLSGKRKYTMDTWGFIDIFLVISSFLTLLDTEKIFPSYDGNGNQISSDGRSDAAFVLRASILSVNDILVWVRITGILLTYKELGPLIRMIYLLSIVAAKYLVIYLILMIAAATIYTTLFFQASESYKTYSITFTTLFQGYLNNGDYSDFEYYKMFGAIGCVGFITIGGLILMNILIALLSNEYTQLSKVVDAAHRSVLIKYYKRYKWDKNYGFLILLTTPLNVINYFMIPIGLLFKEKKIVTTGYESGEIMDHNDIKKLQKAKEQVFNEFVSRVYFTLFYFPVILIIEMTLSFLLIPICYIIGIFSSLSGYYSKVETSLFSVLTICFCWIIGGPFFLIYRYFVDIVSIFKSIYIKFDVNSNDLEKKRIKDVLQPEDIRNFLTFIHKREKNNQNDLHTLFFDFLEYEHQKKEEVDKNYQKNAQYLENLRKAGRATTKNAYVFFSTMYNHSIFKDSKRTNTTGNLTNTGNTTKRNLIIIEILENFILDDGSDNYIVDIEKMKILLPKTMNITNAYVKRFVYTGISSLNKAVNKRKNKSNAFLQHKLLNKIVGSVVRLDKVIDGDGNSDPLQSEEARKANKFDLEENEDDFYPTLSDILKKMLTEVGENIRNTEKKILEEENKLKKKKGNSTSDENTVSN